MKRILLLISLLVIAQSQVWSQCSFSNILTFAEPKNMTPTSLNQTITNAQVWASEYVSLTAVAGNTYRISTCTGNSYDTELTIFPGNSTTHVAYNDNFCSTQSQIDFTPSVSDTYRIQLNQKNCAANATNSTINITLINAAALSISSISAASPNPSNASTVNYTVTFSGSVSGLNASNFSLSTNGITGASVGTPTGSGTTWAVPVNTGSGSGSLQLQLVNDAGLSSPLGNEPFTTGDTYTIDKAAPTITVSTTESSITLNNSFTVNFNFNESVTGFASGDINVSNGTLSNFSGSGSTYSATVSTSTFGIVTVSVPVNVATDSPGNNNTASNTLSITVLSPPSGVSVNNTNICSDTPVSLTGTCTAGTLTWYNQSAGGSALGTGSSFSQSPTSTTTYYASCESGSVKTSRVASQQVNVTMQPVIPTASDVTICTGTEAILTASCSTGNVRWYNALTGGTLLGSNNTFTTNILTANAQYYVSCETGDSPNCTSLREEVQVTVNPLPTLGATVLPSSTVCSGTSVTLSGTGASIYVWSNGVVDGAPFIISSTNNYLLKGTDVNGCSNTLLIPVNVNPAPIANAITGINQLCEGSNNTLTAIPGGGSGTLSVQWQSSDTSVATINSTTGEVTGVRAGSTNITYTVTDAFGCSIGSAIFAVTVNPLPVANAITGVSEICLGSATMLTANASGGTGSLSIQWYSSNTAVATINSTTGELTALSAGTSNITYTVNDSKSCSAVSPVFAITVNPMPIPGSITGSNEICTGNATTLMTSPGGGTGNLGIQWYSSNTAIATINTSTGEIAGVSGGTTDISYIVTDAKGCLAVSANFIVSVNALPIANVINGTSSICINDLINLAAGPSGGTGALTLAWESSNSTIATVNSTSGQVMGISAGNTHISYTVTDSKGCSAISSAFAIAVNPLSVGGTISGSTNVCLGSNSGSLVLSAYSGNVLRWERSNNNFTTFTSISNTSAMQAFSNLTSNTYYRAVVKNGICGEVYSDTALVTVDNSLQYQHYLIINLMVCNGANSIISLIPSSSSLTFQWQESSGSGFSNLSNNTSFSGVTNDTLELSNVMFAKNQYLYRCIISNTCGSIVSDTTRLQVLSLPSISQEPVGQTVCPGNQTILTVEAIGDITGYLWQVNEGSGFMNIIGLKYSGQNSPSLMITNITNDMSGFQYRCIVSSQCATINSNAATIMVDPTITILSQPSNRTVCQNSTINFSSIAAHLSGGTLNYQWQIKSGNNYLNLSNNSIYGGVNSATLTLTNVPANLNGAVYRCLINGYCQTINSTLTVTPVVTILQNPLSVNICQSHNTQFSISAAGTGLTYRWQVNAGTGFANVLDGGVYQGATNAILQLNQPQTSMNGYQYRCIVRGTSTCDTSARTSAIATLGIRVAPEAQLIVAQSAISGGNITYQAVQYVLGINIISSSARVEYSAGNAILLNPGFMTDNGSVFTAKVQNACLNGAFGSNNLPEKITK